MLKIIKSLFLLLFVIGITSYATWAFISQTKTSGDEAGEITEVLGAKNDPLTIQLRGDGNDYNKAYFNVSDLIPGETVTSCLEIRNPNDSEDVFFRVYADQKTNDHVEDGKNMADLLEIDFNEDNEGLCSTPNGYTRYNSNTGFPEGIFLSSLIGSGNAVRGLNEINGNKVMKSLKTGEAAVYQISVTLDKKATNNVINKKWTGNLVVDAVQSLGQDTDPDNVVWK